MSRRNRSSLAPEREKERERERERKREGGERKYGKKKKQQPEKEFEKGGSYIFRPLWNKRGVKSVSKPEEPLVISAGPLTRVFRGVASHYAIRGLPRYAKNLRVFTPRLRGFAGYRGVGVATTLQLRRSFLSFSSSRAFFLSRLRNFVFHRVETQWTILVAKYILVTRKTSSRRWEHATRALICKLARSALFRFFRSSAARGETKERNSRF